MADDYLWDRSGTPDPDVLYLERLLPRVREHVRRAPGADPVPALLAWGRRRVVLHGLALAACVLIGVGGFRLATPTAAPDPAAIRGETLPAAVASAPPSPPPASAAPTPAPSVQRAAPRRHPVAVPSAEPPPDELASERSPASIAAVVAQHRAEVKSRCWEPALAQRKDGAATTVRVTASFTIEKSGSVTSATAGPSSADYPSLAGCVAAEVGRWRFGPAGAAVSARLPFVFTEG